MCARWGDKHSCQKDNLETVTEQVCLESSLKRGGRIRVAECLQQIVLNGWASVRMFLCLHKGWQRFRCRMWIVIVKTTQEALLHLTMPGCHLILMGPKTQKAGNQGNLYYPVLHCYRPSEAKFALIFRLVKKHRFVFNYSKRPCWLGRGGDIFY